MRVLGRILVNSICRCWLSSGGSAVAIIEVERYGYSRPHSMHHARKKGRSAATSALPKDGAFSMASAKRGIGLRHPRQRTIQYRTKYSLPVILTLLSLN